MIPDEKMLELIKKALRIGGGTHELEDILVGIRQNVFQLFSADSAIVVTEILQSPRKKILNVFLVAGDFESIMGLTPKVDEFAKSEGCSFMITTGRFGLIRRLPKFGWNPAYVTFKREL